MNQPWVAAVKIKIAVREVTTTIKPCQKLSIPIKRSSELKINTIGKIPVLKLYQNAWTPVLIGSAFEIVCKIRC